MDIMPIFPGRFQPFHNGHLWVLEWMVRKYGWGTVAIVNPDPVHNRYPEYKSFHHCHNPFNYWERYQHVREVFKGRGLWNLVRIIPLEHPRQRAEIDRSFLPDRRVWIIPALDNHEIEKIADFRHQGEEVNTIEPPAEVVEIRSSLIRSCLYYNVDCCRCYPKEIYQDLWVKHGRFEIKRLFEKYKDIVGIPDIPGCAVAGSKWAARETQNIELERTMGRVLLAIGEAVVQAAGPVGAPLKFLMEIYRSKLDNKQQTDFVEALCGPLESRLEVLERAVPEYEKLKSIRKLLLLTVEETTKDLGASTSEELVGFLETKRGSGSLFNDGLRNTLRQELNQIFSADVPLLQTCLREVGFPLAQVNWQQSTLIVVSEVLDKLQWLDIDITSNFFSQLATTFPGAGNAGLIAASFAEFRSMEAKSSKH